MADISSLFTVRHLRSEPNAYVLHYRKGSLLREGRGLTFWFYPTSASIAEIPCDDREVPFMFHGRSLDFQDITAQGVVTYRVVDPKKLAARIDFSINIYMGTYLKEPLEQISQTITRISQQLSWDYMANTEIKQILSAGIAEIRKRIEEGLVGNRILEALGLEIVNILVSDVSPTPDMEKALQTPMREEIQQQADEATFQRRALAVEKERAIQENELENRIELAKRKEQLIGQQGRNKQRLAREESEAQKITATTTADCDRLAANAKAEGIVVIEKAKVDSEKERLDAYRDLPASVMFGLALKQLAGKLERIDHLNLSPDGIGHLLQNLMQAGTRKLERPDGA